MNQTLADLSFPGGFTASSAGGQCPLCMQDARQLGGVILITPGQLAGSAGSQPITGAACVDCLGLLSILLDGLQGGKIRGLADKLIQAGFVKKR